MTEPAPPGRPAVTATGKPRRHRRPHRRKHHAPFLHAHPLARPGLKGHVASAPIAAEMQPEEKT